MNVYDIITPFNISQRHCVVAPGMCEAERVYKQKYGAIKIIEIKLHAEYVLVSELARESDDE